MSTLLGTPVLAMPPCRKFGAIHPVVTPRPTCIWFELDPPTDWLTRSEKLTLLDLKAIVLMLARLFPMTSSFCWLAVNPERLVEKDIHFTCVYQIWLGCTRRELAAPGLKERSSWAKWWNRKKPQSLAGR